MIDLRDSANPKHLGFLPPANEVFWYENLLGLALDNAIVFYRIDRQKGLVEISRIDRTLARDVSISHERMTVCRRDKGYDIYQLNFTQKNVLNLRLF